MTTALPTLGDGRLTEAEVERLRAYFEGPIDYDATDEAVFEGWCSVVAGLLHDRLPEATTVTETASALEVLGCGFDTGERPGWMSPGQYDPCPCVRPKDHDGDHGCRRHDQPADDVGIGRFRRTVTRYADHIGPWEPVEDGEQ